MIDLTLVGERYGLEATMRVLPHAAGPRSRWKIAWGRMIQQDEWTEDLGIELMGRKDSAYSEPIADPVALLCGQYVSDGLEWGSCP